VDEIGSTLGDQIHLRSGGTAGGSVVVAGGHTEFLQRIQRGSHGALEGIAFQLVVIV
jgi:hypothetical protein